MLASGKRYPTKTFFPLSRWSPCRIMALFFEVPPQAQYVFSFVARSGRLTLFPSMPSTIVAGWTPFFHFFPPFSILHFPALIPPATQTPTRSPHQQKPP